MKRSTRTPALDAFRSGRPIKPIGFIRGRAIMPIAGGAPDDDGKTDDGKTDDGKTDDGKTDDGKTDDGKTGPKKGDVGYFPPNTPRAQMSAAEQIAYDAHHGRKHEDRAKEWQRVAGGKTAAEVEAELAELDKLRKAQMNDGEKAVDEAKTQGRREASLAVAPQMFDVALEHVDEDRRKVLIETLDMSKVIKEDGTIDTDKVKSIAATLAPAPAKGDPDYGNGKRRTDTSSSGVGTGRSRYRERHGKADKDS